MRIATARARRALVSVACLSIALAIVGALASPGYREPELWTFPTPDPVAPHEDSPAFAVSERTVELTIRGHGTSGLLLSPAEPRVALVMVHGSGPASMHDGHETMVALARSGVAVLSPDKVMTGYSPFRRDYGQLGNDAVEAAGWLQQELHLESAHVGLLGRSEGGWVSLLAAQQHPELRGPIVVDSAPVVTALEQTAYVATGQGRLGFPATRRVVTAFIATGRPIVDYLDTDVRPALPGITNRVVAVFGAADFTVPVTQAIAQLQAGLPQPPTVLLAPGGHLPQPDAWAPTVAQTLVTTGIGAGVWTVGGAHPPTRSTGAPTPPAPSPALDPRWHFGLATLLVFALRYARPAATRNQETRP